MSLIDMNVHTFSLVRSYLCLCVYIFIYFVSWLYHNTSTWLACLFFQWPPVVLQEEKEKSHGAQKAYLWLGLFTSQEFYVELPLQAWHIQCNGFKFFGTMTSQRKYFEMNTYFLSPCGQGLRVIACKELSLWLF